MKTAYWQHFPPPEPSDDPDVELEIIAPEPKLRPPVPELPPNPPQAAAKQSTALLYLSPIERLSSLPQARKGANVPLPEATQQDILNILTGSFYQHHGIDLEAHPEALRTLEKLARKYRIDLQDHEVLPVEIDNLLPDLSLKTVLLRDSLLTLLELHASPERVPYDTPPIHCPACQVPLMGRWDCASCGYELLSPERAALRKPASILPQTWLPPGYFVVPDMQSGRLLLVNTHRFQYVTWQMDFRNLPGIRQPWDMLWLENMHFLITDRANHRVFECDQGGRILWELPQPEAYPERLLKNPSKATLYLNGDQERFLIVDQGQHRVLEMDRAGQIHWQFGVRGVPGHEQQHLNDPTDIQYTHERSYLIADRGNDRVLEIRNQRIIHIWGAGLNLNAPCAAQRLLNGHTLIVDGGNTRILELNKDDEVLKEVFYFKEGMDERFDMRRPLKMVRRENQNLVLIDANRVMEVDLLSKQIVWFSFLHDLHMSLEIPTRLSQTEIKISETDPEQFIQSQPADTMPTVRRTLQKIGIFQSGSIHFFDELEALLKYRSFKAGEQLLKRQQISQSLYLLQSGRVEMLNTSENQATLVLEAGDSFGLMGIVYPEARTTSMRALTDGGAYVLDKRDFDSLLPKYPEIAKAVNQLASERLVLARLRQTPKSHRASERLQALLEKNREQAHLRLKGNEASPETPWSHQNHRLDYSPTEQRVIQAAALEGMGCLELHISLNPKTRMKAARVSLIVAILDQLGTLIRTEPNPDAILNEDFEHEVILSLLTSASEEHIQDDICGLADVEQVEIFKVEAQQIETQAAAEPEQPTEAAHE